MRKIKDSKGKTFAIVVGKGTVEIKRSNQHFIITGSDFSVLGTSAFSPDEKEYIQVEDGQLVEEGLNIVSSDNISDEEREQMEKQKEEAQEKAETQETEKAALKDKDENKSKDEGDKEDQDSESKV